MSSGEHIVICGRVASFALLLISSLHKTKIILWKRSDSSAHRKKIPPETAALKWYPRELIGWTRHHTITAANQNDGDKCILSRNFTIWPAKKNGLEKAIHYLATRSNDKVDLFLMSKQKQLYRGFALSRSHHFCFFGDNAVVTWFKQLHAEDNVCSGWNFTQKTSIGSNLHTLVLLSQFSRKLKIW